MASSVRCTFLRLKTLHFNLNFTNLLRKTTSPIYTSQERHFAARKHSRASLKKKSDAAKLSKMLRLEAQAKIKIDPSKLHSRRNDAQSKLTLQPVDNVWCASNHKRQGFDLGAALDMHRQTLHPTVLNMPDALVYATIELNMKAQKKGKFLNPFSSVVGYPHSFVFREEKKIIAFCRGERDQQMALDAGAIIVGADELIKKFQNGDFGSSDYDHIVAHFDMVPELTPLRGLLKKHFPTKAMGNVSTEIGELVKLFRYGISFAAQRDTVELDYGWVDVVFGRLKMSNEQLEDNFKKLLEQIEQFRPKNVNSDFITDAVVWAAPSTEKFHVFFWDYLADAYNGDEIKKRYTVLEHDFYVAGSPLSSVQFDVEISKSL